MNKVVLSINPNKAMNYLLKSVIKPEYHLITVDNVYDATNELKKTEEITTIIIDLDQSEKEVWEFIHHVKTSRFYFKPLIALTSDKSTKMNKQVEEARIKHLFYKPFSPVEILKKIDDL